jgi:ribosomal protein S18 acetylase RimI-like enzyme
MSDEASTVLRFATPEDYDLVIGVVDAWWGGRRMAASVPRLFFQHFQPTNFVAESAGRLVGFLCGFRSQTRSTQAYVHFVGVSPEGRRRGIGRALYARFFDTARALGCSEVQCVTSPRNTLSLAFHRSLGFEILPGDTQLDDVSYVKDYDGPGEDRVKLRKYL